MDAGNIAGRHGFGLAERGAADSQGAGIDLLAGYGRGFMRLGVGPEIETDRRMIPGHFGNVAFERAQFDDQRRRCEPVARAGPADQGLVGSEVGRPVHLRHPRLPRLN